MFIDFFPTVCWLYFYCCYCQEENFLKWFLCFSWKRGLVLNFMIKGKILNKVEKRAKWSLDSFLIYFWVISFCHSSITKKELFRPLLHETQENILPSVFPKRNYFIFVEPDPPSGLVLISTSHGYAVSVGWDGPAVGSATGYFVSDSLGNSNMRVLDTSFK